MQPSRAIHVRSAITVGLPADLTDAAVDDLGPVLRQLASDDTWREVRLDGAAVRHLTARALGLLVALPRIGAAHDVRVVIRNASTPLRDALAVGRLVDRVELDGDDSAGADARSPSTCECG